MRVTSGVVQGCRTSSCSRAWETWQACERSVSHFERPLRLFFGCATRWMNSQVFKLSLLRGDEGSSQDRDLEWLRVFRHFDPRLRDFFGQRDQALPVDEIVGEVWGRAFLFISTLKDAAALWSWLTTVGNNVIRDRVRSHL